MHKNYSRIIAGTMNWGQWGAQLSTAQMSELIQSCYAIGISTFDHADIYGDYTTEADFGAAFKASEIPRASLQFISKCGIALVNQQRGTRLNHYNYTKEYILNAVERSLNKLQTSYLDLLLLHRPSPLMDPEVIDEAITELTSKGYIKSFGLSNFTSSQVKLISQKRAVTANQIEVSLATSTPMFNGELDYCMRENILPMAWAPLGGLMGKKVIPHALDMALEKLCEKYKTPKDGLLLAWLMSHPSGIHPVVGTTKIARHKTAVAACDIIIETEDWFYILAAYRGYDIP
ncbi:MAG: aldo/keto reductase [Flavobacteriia bacterium]|nr:aldo/keto reductase [Flavobacteriia bacterium]